MSTAKILTVTAVIMACSLSQKAYAEENPCVPRTDCHPTGCVLREDYVKQPPAACTYDCQPGTLDCGGYCRLEDDGVCTAYDNEGTKLSAAAAKKRETESDICVPKAGCHPTECVRMSDFVEQPQMACTMDCRPGTLDCGGSCRLVNNECKAYDGEGKAIGRSFLLRNKFSPKKKSHH